MINILAISFFLLIIASTAISAVLGIIGWIREAIEYPQWRKYLKEKYEPGKTAKNTDLSKINYTKRP